MQLLPSEIKCLIVDLVSSSESPTSSTPTRSLAALARTHSAFQREAERALYGTLFIYAFTNKSLKCMETLATNQEKAALVRFLSIVYTCFNKTTKLMNQILRTYLSKILINMHSLSDFRVKSLPGGREAEGEMMRGLGKILWSVCKILILSKLSNNSGDDKVKVIFDCTLFSAAMLSTFRKSLRVKPNCRYLDYILVALAVREAWPAF